MRAMGAGALINCCPYFLLSVYYFQDISPPPRHSVPSLPTPSFLSPFITLTSVQGPKPGGTGAQRAGSWFEPTRSGAIAPVRKDAGGAHGAKAKAQGLRWVTSASG